MNWIHFLQTHYPAGKEPHLVDFKDLEAISVIILANTGESPGMEAITTYLSEENYQYQMLSNRVHYMM
jgi:hypothetical protein